MITQLTKEQLAILRHISGVGLITAGAGCGKTTTLLEYIVHCIYNIGAEPAEFLILSFSKAAGDEFKERLQKYRLKHGGALLDLSQVKVMTYEAFGYEIIRYNFSELGFDEVPSVITTTRLIGQCVAKIAKQHGANRKELMKDVAVKCQSLVLENENPLVDKVGSLYQKRKQAKNLVDFQDMVSLLLASKKRYLKEAAKKYRYLLVDELQDTNQLQAKMLVTLAKTIQTTLMVGDPKQNIYEFRGAYGKNWAFIKAKLKPKEYKLTLTQRIPKASLPFINALGNEIHPGAQLTSNVKGQPVQFVNCKDFGNEQATFIVNEINRVTKSGEAKPEEIVCLGRTRRILSDLSIRLELILHGFHGHLTKRLF